MLSALFRTADSYRVKIQESPISKQYLPTRVHCDLYYYNLDRRIFCSGLLFSFNKAKYKNCDQCISILFISVMKKDDFVYIFL